MEGNWFTALWESVFPQRQKYNIEELRIGMAKYVASTYEPAPKKPTEKRPQSTTPIPRKPEKTDKTGHTAQHSMREEPSAYGSSGQNRPA